MAKTETERFWEKVQKSDECWEWKGAMQFATAKNSARARGYGNAYLGGKVVSAHRASWILANGEIPPGMSVLHHCDNRACVRPEHLFLGTAKDNTRDMMEKGRSYSPGPTNPQRGEDRPMAKLTSQDVLQIDARLHAGESHNAIAKDFGVHRTVVSGIARRERWKHLFAEEKNRWPDDEH